MPQFEVSTYPSQVFWLVICFSFLCLVMVFHLAPRLKAILEARERRLGEDKEQSQEINHAAASLKQEGLAHLAEAQKKAHAILHGIIQEIHHQKSERLARVDEELARKTKEVRHHLALQTQHILENKDVIVSEIIQVASSRLLGQSLTQRSIQPVVRVVIQKQGKT